MKHIFDFKSFAAYLQISVIVLLLSFTVSAQTPTPDAKKQEADSLFADGRTLVNQGTAKSMLLAIPKLEAAGKLYQELNDKLNESYCLGWLGNLTSALGEKQKLLIIMFKPCRLTEPLAIKPGEARTLTNIDLIYKYLGEKQKAFDYYTQALPLSKAIGDKAAEAATLNSTGLVYDSLGEKQKALEYYQLSLPISKYVGDLDGQANILGRLRKYWNSLNNPRLAIFYGKQAINLYQQLRSKINGLDKEIQKSFLKKNEFYYRDLADILIANGRLAEAQQVLNLLKDQQFFDFSRSQNEPIKQVIQSPQEIKNTVRYQQTSEQIGIAGQQIETLKKRIGTGQLTADEAAQLQKLDEYLKTATNEFLNFLKQAETDFAKPVDDKDKINETSDTREIQNALHQLNQQTGQKIAAVYTLVGEENYRALIVSPDGIKSVSFPIKGDELNEKAVKLWGLLQSDKYDTTVLSKQIYDVVFAPIEKELPKDTTTIMWSLDGNLRYLPMAALWDGKQYLAERFNHVNFTRADSERMTRNLNPNWTGLGFGTTQAQTVDLFNDGNKINFSALPGVTEELKEVFKQSNSSTGILTGEVLPDAKFTRISFLESMKQHRPVVHIASHFSFRPGDEARSFLLLGDGTAFTLNDMKKETNLF